MIYICRTLKQFFYPREYIFLIFLNSLRRKNLIKYNFENSRNFDLKRLTITTTVTKLLRFTWVMFNVTRMVFLRTATVLPGQSCLKCVYPSLTPPSNFYVCLVMWSGRKLFLSASPVQSLGTSHPLGSTLSIRVMCAANFIFSEKEKNSPYPFSTWATTTRSTPYPNCVPVITEIQKAPRSFRTLTKRTLYTLYIYNTQYIYIKYIMHVYTYFHVLLCTHAQ